MRLLTTTLISLLLAYSGWSQPIYTEHCLTDQAGDNRYATYSPDGKHILFESNRDGNWEIYRMRADGSQATRLTHNDHPDRRPSWSPNGKRILFESEIDGINEIYELRPTSGKIKKLLTAPDGGTPMFARYAPNGRQFAVTIRDTAGQFQMHLYRKNGKLLRQLTPESPRSLYPNWSPDGRSIVYFSRDDTAGEVDEIYRLDVRTGTTTRLTNWPQHNFCPAWSNGGDRIAYVTSMAGSRPEIYLMHTDGTNQQRITYNDDGDTLPAWSPDDRHLMITAFRNGQFNICVISLE